MAKEKQLEIEINDSNELVLLESRTMRDQHVYRDSVLEKVKAVAFLTDDFEVSIDIAASYYEVPNKTIETAIRRNRSEFNDYSELRVLKGASLKVFKTNLQDEGAFKGISSLTLLNRRGLLRLGMLLTESEVAKSIRNYLLNVEEVSDKEQKLWAIEREISKRERRMLTDHIQEFYKGTLKAGFEYSTFTNLVYKVLFDSNKAQLMKAYELDKNDALRDAFSTEDLRKVVKVERAISSLLLLGKDYQEIKIELLEHKERFQ
ncbi:hypothetical protein [Niallia circulans]|uniref:hypothetical protein n=1 Tax=Niallia circulans TaxID=1397 RepID=UPI0026F0AEB2|nr:hypothetical protein [Niallia circulans]